MAYRNFTSQVYSMLRDMVILDLIIPTNGATTPVAASVRGIPGAVVTRIGIGTYTIVLPAGFSFPARPCVSAILQASALQNVGVQVLTWVAATRTLTVQCQTPSTGAAVEWPAANADSNVLLTMIFHNTSQIPVK